MKTMTKNTSEGRRSPHDESLKAGMNSPERRFMSTANLRIEKRQGGAPIITGYASVYYRLNDPDTEYRIYDMGFERCVERIMPGAFNRALRQNQDVRALFNHDPNCVLGRTASGTCRLYVDGIGLRYEIDPPDTHRGRELATLIDRGDVDGSSFSFEIPDPKQDQTFREVVDDKGKLTIYREIHIVDLFDVSPVVYPAYKGTTAGVRQDSNALAEVRSAYKTWKELQAEEVRKKQQREKMDARLKQIAKTEGWAGNLQTEEVRKEQQRAERDARVKQIAKNEGWRS